MYKLILTIDGRSPTRPHEWTEESYDIDRAELIKELPQMIRAMTDPLVPQIEDPESFLNGWQIDTIIIEKADNDDV